MVQWIQSSLAQRQSCTLLQMCLSLSSPDCRGSCNAMCAIMLAVLYYTVRICALFQGCEVSCQHQQIYQFADCLYFCCTILLP